MDFLIGFLAGAIVVLMCGNYPLDYVGDELDEAIAAYDRASAVNKETEQLIRDAIEANK